MFSDYESRSLSLINLYCFVYYGFLLFFVRVDMVEILTLADELPELIYRADLFGL